MALLALDDMMGKPLPPHCEGDEYLAVDGTATTLALEMARELDKHRAYVEGGVFVRFSDLTNSSVDIVDLLVQHGVFERQLDEFGDMMLALLSGGVRFEQVLEISDCIQVVGAPCHAEASSATKLDLVVQLVREGWKARDLVLDALQPGGHRCFGLNMLV